jgi:hypothetical protein
MAYTNILSHNAIRLCDEYDELVWSWNNINGFLLAKMVYEHISINLEGEAYKWWLSLFWKWKCPLKT